MRHSVSILTYGDRTEEEESYDLNKQISRLSIANEPNSRNLFHGLANNLLRIYRIRNVIKGNHFNAVIAMGYSNNVILALASVGLKGVSTVGSERSNPEMAVRSKIWMFLCKYGYFFLDTIVCLTPDTTKWIRENSYARRVVNIPNGTKLPLLNSSPIVSLDDVRAEWGVVLCVGRLIKLKQFDHAISSFNLATKQQGNWHLFFAGEGDEYDALRDLAISLGVDSRVHFLGAVGNIGDWFKRADIYLLTSKYEGFPNSLLEAMAHGAAAVSYDCPTGPSEMLDDEVNGYLISPNNKDSLSSKLGKLIASKQLRMEFSSAAIESSKYFLIENVVSLWLKELENISKS